MKPTFAPLSFKREEPVQSFARKSFFKKSLHDKYTYFKNKEFPVKIPRRSLRKNLVYTPAQEIPFVEFQPTSDYMLKFLIADDSGDRKDKTPGLTYDQKKSIYLNQVYSQKLEYETALLNQEYLEWKSFHSSSGPRIRWTGEVTYYGSYILFNIALLYTPDFFIEIFFKSGMYQTKGGRFVILQFLEQILNIRFVKPYYDQLELLGKIKPEDLEKSPIYQAFLSKMTPGYSSAFPILQGTLAIAQSLFRERDIPFSRLFMKNLPALLQSASINFVTATFVVNNLGGAVPVMVCQIASSVLVQFLGGQITKLTQVYFFSDLAAMDRLDEEMLKRKLMEEERQKELEIRKEYVKIGIVGKDIDERIKMKFDWEGYFGKNIASFQEGLYKAWKTRGDAVPVFGASGFNTLLLLWGFSTTAGFTMFMTTNDFQGYQYASGKQINIRFFFDFLTKMLRSFKFFDNIFSVESLALPVVQKLRNDLIRVFTELLGNLYTDMNNFVGNVTKKAYYTSSNYGFISSLQKQSMFAYYFFTAMENILGKVSQISNPAFKLILENYLNLAVPLSQNIVSNMFRFSIEDSLALFESMNLFFLQFGVAPMMTSDGQISFYDTLLRQCTKGRITSRAQLLYRPKEEIYSFLEPGSLLAEVFGYFSIHIPKSFSGFEEKLALLPLPNEIGERITFLDLNLNKLPPTQRQEVIKIFQQIGVLQKIPAIFNFFLQEVVNEYKGKPVELERALRDSTGMKALFEKKMREPETIRLFEKLQISSENISLLTSDLFTNFASRYTGFLTEALKSLNRDRDTDTYPNEFEMSDVTLAKMDRTTMSAFADYFAEQYSEYVTDLVYTTVPLFSQYTQPFTHSYSFSPQPGEVEYHNISVARQKPTGAGANALEEISLENFTTNVLNPGFFVQKFVVKKRGKIVNGKPVEDDESPTFYDFEKTVEITDAQKQKVIRSFAMMTRMGYKIYYRKSKTAMGGETPAAVASALTTHFKKFFTDMISKRLTLKGLPKTWGVTFFEENLYLSPGDVYYSPEANVVQIGGNTHFFFSWVQHAGLRRLIIPPGYGLKGVVKGLDDKYRRGLLRGEYLDRYILLSAALLHNENSMETTRDNQTAELDALYRESDRLGLRTMDQVNMFELFRGILIPNGPVNEEGKQTLLSGDNPNNLTLGQIFGNIIRSIDLHGMFPDQDVAIYGSPGGDKSGKVIGNLEAADRAGSWVRFPWANYQTIEEYLSNQKNMISFQRFLAYTIHGWFYRLGGVGEKPEPAVYRAKLVNDDGKPINISSDTTLLGPDQNPNSLDILGYRAKVQDSKEGFRFSDIEGHDKVDDLIVFLKLLYLITDENGQISVPEYQKHMENLTEPVDPNVPKGARKGKIKEDQLTYINQQIMMIEASGGNKKSNFVDCLLKGNCYEYSTPREQAISISIHTLFQIDYYLQVLNVKKRIKDKKGIKNHEIYDGKTPYFNSVASEHLGQFYFNFQTFMGIDLRAVEAAFTDSALKPEYSALVEAIKIKKRGIIVNIFKAATGTDITEENLTQLIDILTIKSEAKVSWKDRLTEWLSKQTGGSLYQMIFGSGETLEKKIEKFMAMLESPEILEAMLGDELDKLSDLLKRRNIEVKSADKTEIKNLNDRIGAVIDRYDSDIEALQRQKEVILGQFDDLWEAYTENKSTNDIPPLLPVEAYRPPPTGDSGKKTEPTAAVVGERPLEAPQLATQKDQAVREGITLANELARAEKIATIQRLRNELSQSQSLAQIEDLRLKLMSAFLELFGSDSSMFGRLASSLLNDYAYDFGTFPNTITLKPPEPKPFEEINPPAFESCAKMSDRYELRGASGVSLKDTSVDVNSNLLEPYLACRTKAFLVGGVKNIFTGLFDISKTVAKFGSTQLCTFVITLASTTLGALIKGGLGFAAGGPFGALGGFASGAAYGFTAGGTLSASCVVAAAYALESYLPRYIDRVLIDEANFKEENLLLDLTKSSDNPYEKIKIYEKYFNKWQAILKNPATKREDTMKIRKNIKNLFTFLLFESKFSENEPGKYATIPTFTTTLFGTGKSSQFNYYPFFKPSLEQIGFISNLGAFDFSKIKKPDDLFTAIQGLKLDLNQATLTVLFGEKYVMPADEELTVAIDSRPSYNIYHRIGETIRELDDFDKRNTIEGTTPQNGNLYEVLTASADIIKRFFSGETQEMDEALADAQRQMEIETEEQRERDMAEQRKASRIFEVGSFMNHIHSLIESVNLNDKNKGDTSVINTLPILVEQSTMAGFAKKNETDPGGVSGNLLVRVIGGNDDNERWRSDIVTKDDRIAIRDMFTLTPTGLSTPYYYDSYLGQPYAVPYGNVYHRMFDVLDYVEKYKGQRTYDFFNPEGFFLTTEYLSAVAWIEGEERGFVSKTISTPKEDYNMKRHGNFPPFLFCEKDAWKSESIKLRFQNVLEKFYVEQETEVTFPRNVKKTVKGWFLKKDIDTFEMLQPPASSTYRPVKLIDAVLNNASFRVQGLGDMPFSLFLDENEKPKAGDSEEIQNQKRKIKWFKGVLLKIIFSTVKDSLQGNIRLSKYTHSITGQQMTVVGFHSLGNGISDIPFSITGEVQKVENVQLGILQREKRRRKETKTEIESDLDPRTKTTRDLFLRKLLTMTVIPEGLLPKKREQLIRLLKAIITIKLGKYFDIKKTNTGVDEEIREKFETDAPTLLSIGLREINEIKAEFASETTSVNVEPTGNMSFEGGFQETFDTLISTLSSIEDDLGEKDEVDKMLKLVLQQTIEIPDSDEPLPFSGGKREGEEEENEVNMKKVNVDEVFPLVFLSVFQTSVYCPNSLLILNEVPSDEVPSDLSTELEE